MALAHSCASRARRILALYPGAAVIPLAWLWVLAEPVATDAYLASLGLLAIALGLEVIRVQRHRDGAVWSLASSLILLAAVGVLRQAGGGIASGVGILALVPVFQAALFGRRRRELWLMLTAEAALYLVPIVIVGGSRYPHSQYRAGVLVVAVSTVVALATHGLVSRVRREASDARGSSALQTRVIDLVHGLSGSGEVRGELCEGAMRIAGAAVAILFELDLDADLLRSTAFAGIPIDSAAVALDAGNPIGGAFLTRRARSIQRITVSQVADPDLWRACGCPRSVIYQPLVRDGVSIGVFAVGWHDDGMVTPARAHMVELLAQEAALVLDQADHLTLLTGMAQTDPLTGLPNRRAWDERVAQALRDERRITVALLDIDHFKRFNDTHGHPAGDRLLRETASAWRELLRGDDVLARLGGEEFGLLLLDCERASAIEVTDRLRRAMAGDQTCSAGLAERRDGEPFEAAVARADRALYEAKAAGRDLARVAG